MGRWRSLSAESETTDRSVFGSKTGGRFRRSGGAPPKFGAQSGLRFGRTDGETYSLHSSEDWGRAPEVTRGSRRVYVSCLCIVIVDTACAEEGTQTPSLPRTPSRLRRAPQRFCQSELQCRHAHSLWAAAAARLRMAGVHSSFPLERPAQL
jgi:hypothetical protein